MPLDPPPGATVYTFDGLQFWRDVGDTYQPWYERHLEFTRDVVLDGDDLDYLDIGAATREPIEVRAVVFSLADVAALEGKLGTTAVLSKTTGDSRDATLVKVVREQGRTALRYIVILTFVPRPLGS